MSSKVFPHGDDGEKNLSAFGVQVREMAASAIFAAGHELKNRAMPLTPKDTGALRRSLNVSVPEPRGGTITVTVGADGRSAPYALAVHEMTGATFQEPGTGAKYLERPFNQMQGEIVQQIAMQIHEMIKKNFIDKPRGGS